MTDVVVWGRRPPPLGGVSRSVQGLSDALTTAKVNHTVVDWRQASALRHILFSRRALHVHNVSNVLRLAFVILAKFLNGARTIVYYHSGTLPAQLRSPIRRRVAKLGFRSVDEVWVTNAALSQVIHDTTRVEAKIVSPFSVASAKALKHAPRPRSVLLFVGYGKELYGLSIALATKRLDAMKGWRWTVVAYGDSVTCEAVRDVAISAGCEVLVNVDPESVSRLVSEHAVLLRPTTADGDAMIVREALLAGARVVASDVVPRPAGTELCSLQPEQVAAALLDGGRMSDGAGLGFSVADQVLDALRQGRDS